MSVFISHYCNEYSYISIALPTASTNQSEYIGINESPLTVTCTATGVPKPNVYWYTLVDVLEPIDDRYIGVQFSLTSDIDQSNGLHVVVETMIIESLNTSYTGTYVCVAKNELATVEAAFSIIVKCKGATILSDYSITYNYYY